MNNTVSARQSIRLLTVALAETSPLSGIAGLADLPGFELIGDAADSDDALRQAIMHCPDVIILPWSVTTPELLRAVVHLRSGHGLPPLVAVLADKASFPTDFAPSQDGVVIMESESSNDKMAENLNLLLSAWKNGKA